MSEYLRIRYKSNLIVFCNSYTFVSVSKLYPSRFLKQSKKTKWLNYIDFKGAKAVGKISVVYRLPGLQPTGLKRGNNFLSIQCSN